MYRIKKFLGKEYERMNQIIDSFNNMESSYINLEACCSCPYESVLEAQKAPIFILPTEGVPGNRYFPNMESIEEIDLYSEELILKLFDLSENTYRATTQPHSGTQANQIVYNAVLKDGDVILSLDTKSGGHISHNKFRKDITVINFGLLNNEIDYQEILYLTQKYHPKLIVIGASSYPNIIDYQRINQIAHENGSLVLADICHTALYVLGKVYPTPFPDVDFVSFTMDKTLRGPQGGVLIYKKDFSTIINYSIFPLTQGGPLQSLQFAKLACLIELNNTNINEYAQRVQHNAQIMNNEFLSSNIRTFSYDNTTHIILIDTNSFNITGLEAEALLFSKNILSNKNMIPNDTRSPQVTSGLRLGVTYITNQGYADEDIRKLSNYIISVLKRQEISNNICIELLKRYNKNN